MIPNGDERRIDLAVAGRGRRVRQERVGGRVKIVLIDGLKAALAEMTDQPGPAHRVGIVAPEEALIAGVREVGGGSLYECLARALAKDTTFEDLGFALDADGFGGALSDVPVVSST